ncbi:hypothetical protein Sp245p_17940 (plasmid) [Azospirillum baldaniorum]|uniref:Uncharacterized protein n=1 Tax=Azospirillum baldaniorum TaxID=1064539 RepID=A0A9P1JUG9_9PROT|nr:hypothetical protein [Azospirillum baldaniorum]AWJ91705.1 hypothetical protein Sp245p_17940 [Azospirillum baldaniorum]TWA83424.1 hypothetical protein FBZ85_101167 [Azospirillum brasilense]CCD00054.1 conserved protein of unknown function [Azospirillum baldaniorum]
MKFIEFTDHAGAPVMINAAGVLYLRGIEGERTEITFAGRSEPLVVAAPLDEVARTLEDATPIPPDPTLALVS